MQLTSNTKGYFDKMLNGQVFNSSLTFITELIQNSQRALAKEIRIDICGDTLTFEDNGCGLSKPEHLLTLNDSSWESTNEGFGLGFWSILAIPDLKSGIIKSKRHLIQFDIEKLKENLQVDYEKVNEYTKGFSVELKSTYFITNYHQIKEQIIKEASVIPINIYLNGSLIEKIDIWEEIKKEPFYKEFNNKYFKAIFSVTEGRYNYPEYYYEYREVCKEYEFPRVKGIIELKKGAVDLKVPDRKDIVYNDKYKAVIDSLKKCVKKTYISFVKEFVSPDNIHLYEEGILLYLTPDEYEPCLIIDDFNNKCLDLSNDISSFKQDFNNTIQRLNELTNDGLWEVDGSDDMEVDLFDISNVEKLDFQKVDSEILDKIDEIKINNTIIKKVKIDNTNNTEDSKENSDNNDVLSSDCEEYTEVAFDSEKEEDCKTVFNRDTTFESTSLGKIINPRKKNLNLKNLIKSNKNLVWVNARETSTYIDIINLAEYYGLFVFTAKNKLQENYLESKNILHIKNLNSYVKKQHKTTNCNPKNKKEELFLNLLEPIEKEYKLQKNIFQIGDLSMSINVTYDGKELLNKSSERKGEKFKIEGLCTGNAIILDRKALNLKSFKISERKSNKFGRHELMAIMCNLNTIAHELAHYLYHTNDNTKEHFERERIISEEILNIYKKLL